MKHDPADFRIDIAMIKGQGGFAPFSSPGVIVTHRPTGLTVTSTSERSQHRNRDIAMTQLIALVEAHADAYAQGRYDEEMHQGPPQEVWDEIEAARRGGVPHHVTHDGAAVVSSGIRWLPIDALTPRGSKCLVIDKAQGVAYLREIHTGDGFTHWHPLPKF